MFTHRIDSISSFINTGSVLCGFVASRFLPRVLTSGVALLALGAAACVSIDGTLADGTLADGTPAKESDSGRYKELTCNGLTPDALAENLSALPALADRPVVSGVLADGTWLLDAEVVATLGVTASGSAVLDYTIGCALESGDVATVGDGERPGYRGRMGLATQWKHGALGAGARRALSACILAHVNAFGVTVPLSVRDYSRLGTTPNEIERYERYEATFYGDLFAPEGAMYVCSGDPAPDMSVPYGSHDMTAGDRLLRRCSDISDTSSQKTLCGFTLVGSCSEVCDTEMQGSHQNCWDSAAKNGISFADTMSVWTLAHDDSDSVWPKLYDQVYGPKGSDAEKQATNGQCSS